MVWLNNSQDSTGTPCDARTGTHVKWCKPQSLVMPQSHHTPGPRTGCSRAVLYNNRTSTHGARAAPYEFCLPVRGPWSFNACIITLRAPYGFRYCKQPVNSPCGARVGSVWPTTTPVRDFCQFWFCQLPYVSVRAPYGTLAGHARAPYGSRCL